MIILRNKFELTILMKLTIKIKTFKEDETTYQ